MPTPRACLAIQGMPGHRSTGLNLGSHTKRIHKVVGKRSRGRSNASIPELGAHVQLVLNALVPFQQQKIPSAQMRELQPKIEINHVTAVATSTCAKQALDASSELSSEGAGGDS